MISNIVFDWSGTLSNDMMQVYETVMKVFERYGVEKIGLDEFRDTYRLPYMVHARMFGIKAGKEELDKVFAEHFRNVGFPEPLPHADETLRKLRGMGKQMIVFSMHRQEFLEEEAQRFFKDAEYFNSIIGNVKNKEEDLKQALDAAGFNPGETLIVGDTEHDIAAGHRAGIRTVAVLSGYRSRKHLEEAKPHFIIDDVRGLLKLGIL